MKIKLCDLLVKLLKEFADATDIPESNEVIYLNGGALISFRGKFYRKISTEEVINEIPKFCGD